MNEQPRALGTHLLLEMNECDPMLLDDMAMVKEVLLAAAEEAGATVVGEVFHKFSPVGVTGIVCIAESHISIHTWPEHRYAAVDIFTCGENLKPWKRRISSRRPSGAALQRHGGQARRCRHPPFRSHRTLISGLDETLSLSHPSRLSRILSQHFHENSP